MKFLARRRPSASMVVAMVALVIAASGTAVAAGRLVAGDKLIKPRSLSGNRLRNHSVTGIQVAAGTLGEVSRAKNADHAFVAGSAENAVNAQDAFSATNAVNASTVGGQPASSFLPASDHVGTGGVTKVAAGSAPVTLFTVGPFTVTMTCTRTGSNTALSLGATSSEPDSVIDSSHDIPTLQIPATSGSVSRSAAGIDFEAPSGTEAIFSAADGVNSLGTDCWANWVGMR